MDIGLSSRDRNNNYFYAMAKIEANNLVNLSRRVSFNHISDAFLRIKFENDIKEFAERNLTFIRNAKTDLECKEGIENIKNECYHVSTQDSMLSLKQAKVYISAKIEQHDKIIGYVIDGIAVILGGMQLVAGLGIVAGSIASGNIVGTIVGAHLILNGASSSIAGIERLKGNKNAIDFMQDTYMGAAEFLGFERKTGMMAYYTADLTTSFYGVIKLSLKPDAWRLYRYLPADYYRKISRMTKPALAIQGIKATNKLRVIGSTYLDDNSEYEKK
ncbi:TPA: DUF4225 domain-containing protein [Yersinia enterocolitica]|nr:DUF4225 domain-containing protein [Yersinia enterocolitica]HDL6901005.1 DUF4225 domain-containing protein [Yersinia enterocolitica]HDL7092111.1 DUF4225 domain-containing protein [Yersinia enterocolitica]HDL7101149.1 DUF4225 domain-containing protein [Yersinia enterocolitica]HDL7135630.1 DUF4225 domain-containing protein [Yersinia enterocolitica]